MMALSKIRNAGFTVSLTANNLVISPASNLTPDQRVFLKQHKAEIISELQQQSILSNADQQTILDYLVAIDETDPVIIDEVLEVCANDADSLTWALAEADRIQRLAKGDTSGLVQCSACVRLQCNKCSLHGFYVVVDKYRQCDDYQPESKVITCHSCQHFQSFYNHGGGAGACNVGVMPSGVCWHSQTKHECDKYQALVVKK